MNRDKDMAFALAEYNRVRKPDMDALRYLDTISGRIWGGALCKFDYNGRIWGGALPTFDYDDT